MSNEILKKPVQVIHFGLRLFHDELCKQNVSSLFTDWRPPCGGNPDLTKIVEKLTQQESSEESL